MIRETEEPLHSVDGILSKRGDFAIMPVINPILTITVKHYSSSDDSIVSVSDTGLITALDNGTAVITVIVDDVSAECNVVVATYLDDFSMLADTWAVVNEQQQVEIFDISPAHALTSFTWAIENETIASIDEAGVITGHFIGKTNLTVTDSYSGISRSTVLHICRPVTAVVLSTDQIELHCGASADIDASVTMSNQSCVDQLVAYSSSDESVVVVNPSTGYITAVGSGTAIITAASGNGVSATCIVIVSNFNILALPDALTTIESEAFTGLPSVDAIRIPAGVTTIAADAFDPGITLLVPAGSQWVQWAEDNGYVPVEE